jgi:hypothetical protein
LAAACAPESQHSDNDATANATGSLLKRTETFFMVWPVIMGALE